MNLNVEFAYTDPKQLRKDLGEYLKDPEKVEREYNKSQDSGGRLVFGPGYIYVEDDAAESTLYQQQQGSTGGTL
jgi:hypothetical protein